MMDICLAIESAIAGGSLALVVGGSRVEKWHSIEGVARSEQLLPRIDELLGLCEFRKEELTRIAVSNGPGSYTGIRIGLATAMGLARALNIPCIGVSLLNALNQSSPSATEKIVVVPLGRGGYCWLDAGSDARTTPEIGSGNIDRLLSVAKERSTTTILAHSDVFENLLARDGDLPESRLIDLGRDMAVAVGLASASIDDGLEPFYARDNSAPANIGAAR